jgi:branched-chain amino acid transport system substrate-binding protein
MNSIKRGIWIFVVLTCGFFLFRDHSTAAQDEIRIGLIAPTTGYGAIIGVPAKQATFGCADKINELGGIAGKKIQLFFEDDESNPVKSVTVAKKLIDQEKVLSIIGPSLVSCITAVGPICEEKKIPMFYSAATRSMCEGKEYVFQMTMPDEDSAQKTVEFLKDNLKSKKVAILHGAGAYEITSSKLHAERATKVGLQVVAVEKYKRGETDFSNFLSQFRKEEADSLIICGSNPEPAVICKNIRQMKMKLNIVCTAGISNPKFLELGGKDIEGVYTQSNLNYDYKSANRITKELFDVIKIKYNEIPGLSHSTPWDAMLILEDALRKVRPDPIEIKKYVENLKNFRGTRGIMNFSPQNHSAMSLDGGAKPDVFLNVVKDGHFSPIIAGK